MTAQGNNRVLVVLHGAGRGRIPRYMDSVFADLRKRPQGDRSVRVHRTGGPRPSLRGVDAIVFWLADPLREWYPACYAEAVAIAEEARPLGIRIVNAPESLSNAIKSRQSRLWREAGFTTPRWIRFESAEELRALTEEVGFPLVVRADETHSQKGMRVANDEEELASIVRASLLLPGCVARLWDVREGYRCRDPEDVYAQLHHKKRIHVLGSRLRTEHVFFSRYPLVCARTCTFRQYQRLPSPLRGLSRVRKRDRHALREDLEHWRRGEEHRDLMQKAAGTLGFSFAAIDYSQKADGGVVLWEANPYPFLPSPHRFRLSRQRLGPERCASYDRAMADFLLELAESRAGERAVS